MEDGERNKNDGRLHDTVHELEKNTIKAETNNEDDSSMVITDHLIEDGTRNLQDGRLQQAKICFELALSNQLRDFENIEEYKESPRVSKMHENIGDAYVQMIRHSTPTKAQTTNSTSHENSTETTPKKSDLTSETPANKNMNENSNMNPESPLRNHNECDEMNQLNKKTEEHVALLAAAQEEAREHYINAMIFSKDRAVDNDIIALETDFVFNDDHNNERGQEHYTEGIENSQQRNINNELDCSKRISDKLNLLELKTPNATTATTTKWGTNEPKLRDFLLDTDDEGDQSSEKIETFEANSDIGNIQQESKRDSATLQADLITSKEHDMHHGIKIQHEFDSCASNKNDVVKDTNDKKVDSSVCNKVSQQHSPILSPLPNVQNLQNMSTLHIQCDDNRITEFQLFTGDKFGHYSETEVEIADMESAAHDSEFCISLSQKQFDKNDLGNDDKMQEPKNIDCLTEFETTPATTDATVKSDIVNQQSQHSSISFSESIQESANKNLQNINPQNFRETLEAANNIAIIHCKRGDYNVAISWYLDVLTKVRAEFGLYHTEAANLLRKIGILTIKIGKYQRCLDCFSAELEVRKKIGNGSHEIIFTKRCLGDIHRRLKNYDESLRYFTEAIDQQQIMGRCKTLASLFNAIGVLQINKGNADDALQHFENAHDVLKEIEGNNDLSIAKILQNKGNAYYAKESFDNAIISYRSSIPLFKRALGCNHEEVLGSLSNIGKAYFGKSLFVEAIQVFEVVLQKQKSNPEVNSLDISSTIESMADIHLKRGSYSESVACYKRSLKIKELVLDSEDTNLLETKRNLAWARFKQTRYTDALSILNSVLTVLKTKRMTNDLDLIITLEMIASVFFKTKDYRNARLNYEEVLNMKLVRFGKNHRQYVSTLHNIALVHGEEGNLDRALELLTDVLQRKYILLGDKHPEVGKAQSDLAHLHFIRHELDLAKWNSVMALKIFVDVKLPKNHTYMKELNVRLSMLEEV